MTQQRTGTTIGVTTGFTVGLLLLSGCLSLNTTAKRPEARAVVLYAVTPIKDVNREILPDAEKFPGKLSDTLNVVATPGEYEPASFVVKPKKDIDDLVFEISDLKAKKGDRIPASSVDLKVVKYWYASSGVENRTECVFNRGEHVLTPELLLNDDSLVLVDHEKKENYLRLEYADDYTGEKLAPGDAPAPGYYWISNPNHDTGAARLESFPVNDSPTLQPVDIRSGKNKQFWVTVHVPDDAAAGIYKGRIDLKTGDETLATVTLQVRVLPFKLASPKTYHDPNAEFISSIYYNEICDPSTADSFLRNKKQMRADLTNMFAHGVTNPTVRQWQDYFKPESLGEVMRIRKDLGVRETTLFYRGTPPHTFYGLGGAEAVKAQVRKVMDFVKPHGIKEVYFYGIDEALDGTDPRLKVLLSQRPMWEAVHEAGGKTYSAGVRVGHYHGKSAGGNYEHIGDLQDMLVCFGPPTRAEAARWHSKGHKIACYANPQSGKEEPEKYRRNYGVLLWRSNYDGAMTFAFTALPNTILSWNDYAQPVGGYRCLNMVYPTDDGVIDTVQWEGYREGIDDIKYATTLMQAVAEAKNSKKKARVALAAEAQKYVEDVDVTGDLDAVRAQIIDYILRLNGRR